METRKQSPRFAFARTFVQVCLAIIAASISTRDTGRFTIFITTVIQ
jgi:hypothetical protein